jgi:hypothetical protein
MAMDTAERVIEDDVAAKVFSTLAFNEKFNLVQTGRPNSCTA